MNIGDILSAPYHLVHLIPIGQASGGAGDWATTWLLGSGLVVVALYMVMSPAATLLAVHLEDRLEAGLREASQGATIDELRRYAHWYVRNRNRLLAIRRASPAKYVDEDSAHQLCASGERLPGNNTDAVWARRMVCLTNELANLRVLADSIFVSWFGLYSIAATTWVVAPDHLRTSWDAIVRTARHTQPSVAALIFAVTTFLVLNAVNWRRRGLSKWRSEHLAAGYGQLSEIGLALKDLRAVVPSAITLWHDRMAQSWSAAQLTVPYDYTAALGGPDADPWSETFDATHERCQAAIAAIEAITADPHKRAALLIAAPAEVRAVLDQPRKALAFNLFAPQTRTMIEDLLQAGKQRTADYLDVLSQAVDAILTHVQTPFVTAAQEALKPLAAAALQRNSLAAVLANADGKKNSDPLITYQKAVERAVDDAIKTVGSSVREHLDIKALASASHSGSTVRRQIIDNESRVREKVDRYFTGAMVDRLGTLRNNMINHLRYAGLTQHRAGMAALSRGWRAEYFAGDDEQLLLRAVDGAIVAAAQAMDSTVTTILEEDIADLVAESADERTYNDRIRYGLVAACRAEADLIDCTDRIEAVLLPASWWSRVRAAFNR
ncbi:Uncharacterised protein [Mycobacteroides abscessus subsp. bolletii]|uniref:hypothetical protein n=1 Tax=Mycobacteroides abscessus TaxID=36809 RepID=UPI0009A63F81|nr:hypothetical protein [Mycobacteroides abscessus]SKS74070.1 Uncharacterised protein [Mycobacteroides abscessus subsp. bolletii]SKS82675.1 Uncharacterised protein [Mycobacteroides abscessus subsp. bolletii]